MFNNNETMTLGRARILSSENDASVSQSTNVNIRIARSQPTIPQPSPSNINFTQPPQTATTSPSQFVQETPIIQERGLNELDDMEVRNRFLELLLTIYEDNPLRVNNYLVCKSSTLMELIKTLTGCDKVELVVDEESGCTGCISNAKYMNIQRILVTKNNQTTDLKYSYNSVYADLIKHSISLKLCV